jgi:ribosomal-protein-alanine N-acetyltransferase
VIVTERLLIRPFEADDLDALHAVYGDPDVTRYTTTYDTLDDTRRTLHEHIAWQEKDGFGFWAVIERASGDLIGDAGIGRFEGKGPEIELGYTFERRSWGRGYATEAGRAWLEHGFGPLGLERIIAVVDPENAASIHVLEKLGMRRAGTRRAYGGENLLYEIDAPE